MVKVIIERRIANGMQAQYEKEIRTTLKSILDAPGYISGKSFSDVENPERKYILTDWRSIGDWQNWQASSARKKAIAGILPMLDMPEKITLLNNE